MSQRAVVPPCAGLPGETIAARATPPGRGGVGIIRISGPASPDVARQLFVPARKDVSELRPYRLHHGLVRTPAGRVLDEAMAVFMPGPGSYTGEDTVEFFCHGSPAVLAAVLAAVFEAGARPAGPGEFTKRAFLNGRLDLSQAEAVGELIAARADTEIDLAVTRLSGGMARAATELREALDALRAGICLAVDFPEEDVDCLPPEEFAARVEAVLDQVEALLAANRRARPFRQGLRVALFGRVNAGKSSLFNALLGRNRALVADCPGTTRDFLEESIDLDGLAVTLTDMAGLRETSDAVEQAGKEQGLALTRTADLGLYVVDGSMPFTPDAEAKAVIDALTPAKVLVVFTKADLPQAAAADDAPCSLPSVRISSRTGQGIADLTAAMRKRLLGESGLPEPGTPAPNEREAASLAAAREELTGLLGDIRAGIPYDLAGVRLETACRLLGDITGESTPDEVLASVFDRFCIGK